MPKRDHNRKRIHPALIIIFLVGGAVWWFLSSEPSAVGWIIAGLLLSYACLGYFYLCVSIPGPDWPVSHPSGAAVNEHAKVVVDKLISGVW